MSLTKAKRKGLSIRGIARELGIHRQTVRKYMDAESPSVSCRRTTSTVS
ncbi:MAG: helix-turn-helix domain-containing protein [Gammaproteobacteria bacterium]|nr:helix-turn-helix domain-containing protein [Gammaproteobacteria bacterium]